MAQMQPDANTLVLLLRSQQRLIRRHNKALVRIANGDPLDPQPCGTIQLL
jgi:hypothetical protein